MNQRARFLFSESLAPSRPQTAPENESQRRGEDSAAEACVQVAVAELGKEDLGELRVVWWAPDRGTKSRRIVEKAMGRERASLERWLDAKRPKARSKGSMLANAGRASKEALILIPGVVENSRRES